ncbi:MAG: hypothetical protein JWM47_4527 [Acidimicrobiales bacterium]|nr:hypothetical protein [Acidimicrobiales bacterium]
MLSPDQAVEQARLLKQTHEAERLQLDTIRRYWKGRQALPAVIPSSSPREVRVMAAIARVNVCAIVVDTLAQSTFVDGFRTADSANDLEVWNAWQANRLDSRQTGIHRAAFAYGAAYSVVTPGDPYPVIRGVSPRNMTAMYGEDQDWPMWALEKLGQGLWRLYDDKAVYYLSEGKERRTGDGKREATFEFVDANEHGLEVTPVVRFLDEEDLDLDDDIISENEASPDHPQVPMRGQVAPLIPVQDQIDLTTFGLLTAQWYSAFRQRWAIGWVAEDERALVDRMVAAAGEDPQAQVRAAAAARQAARLQAGASQFWTFDENPENMKIGEFEQTNLDGYINSRDASMTHAASLSQTPVHELTGKLVNLSAEALAAAEAGKDRKVDERKTNLGEAHEQELWLAGKSMGVEVPDDAQVVWRDTSARAFSATVDALGKLVTMLGIPPQELWERVPGATQQDVERWKDAAANADSFSMFADLLNRQAAGPGAPAPVVA